VARVDFLRGAGQQALGQGVVLRGAAFEAGERGHGAAAGGELGGVGEGGVLQAVAQGRELGGGVGQGAAGFVGRGAQPGGLDAGVAGEQGADVLRVAAGQGGAGPQNRGGLGVAQGRVVEPAAGPGQSGGFGGVCGGEAVEAAEEQLALAGVVVAEARLIDQPLGQGVGLDWFEGLLGGGGVGDDVGDDARGVWLGGGRCRGGCKNQGEHGGGRGLGHHALIVGPRGWPLRGG